LNDLGSIICVFSLKYTSYALVVTGKACNQAIPMHKQERQSLIKKILGGEFNRLLNFKNCLNFIHLSIT